MENDSIRNARVPKVTIDYKNNAYNAIITSVIGLFVTSIGQLVMNKIERRNIEKAERIAAAVPTDEK